MRTTWLMVGALALTAPMMTAGCGDDTTGSGGSGGAGGGAGGSTTTTTSAGGAGGTGGGDPIFADTCPGGLVTLDPGQQLSVPGNTTNGTDTFSNFCGDEDGDDVPDQVVQVTVTGACTLQVSLAETGDWDGLISIRNEGFCAQQTGGQDRCVNFSEGGGESFAFHAAPGTYHVVVDGTAAGDAGAFTLNLVCAAPDCGDGVVNPGEECDYGAGTPNDGCIDPGEVDECTVEQAVAGDTCAEALAVAVALNDDLFLPAAPPLFNTTTAGDDYQHAVGTCISESGGRDHVYAVTPSANGKLSIVVGQDYDGVAYCLTDPNGAPCIDQHVYVRTGDCATGTQVACFDPETDFFVTTGELDVVANQTYYVFVDGYDAEFYSNGPYLLRLGLSAP